MRTRKAWKPCRAFHQLNSGAAKGSDMENFPKEYLTELTEIFREYSEIQKMLSDPSDKSKLVRKRLSQLVSNINKLHETLNAFSSAESALLGKSEVDNRSFPFSWLTTGDNQKEIENLNLYLVNLKARANRALDFFKDSKAGRPEDLAMKHFIKRMIHLWIKITGKRPSKTYPTETGSKNEFLDFVFLSSQEMGYPSHSKTALAKAIQRVLS